MKKLDLSNVAKGVRTFTTKHGPAILMGFGFTSMVGAVAFTADGTVKALKLIEEAKAERGYSEEESLPKKEVFKTCWKCYIPAGLALTTSVACFLGANSVNARRTAALAAAYQISETALSEYRDKVIETIGEETEQVVREKVAEKQIEKNPVNNSEVIVTGIGEVRCFDPLSSRYFTSDRESLRSAENILNKRMLYGIGESVSLNEFYDEIGLPRIDLGDHIGWNSEHLIDLDITAHVSDDGKPSLVVGHYNAPKYEFY